MTSPLITADTLHPILAELGFAAKVASFTQAEGHARLVLEVDAAAGTGIETLRQEMESRLLALDGVDTAAVILTAEKAAPAMPGRKVAPAKPIAGVDRIIAVASGKGGVGKSTTAVNLALALQAAGWHVGILDLDIYGPSLPRLLNISGPPEITADKRMIPHIAHGMPVLSMGFLVPEEKAAIWRGAMVQGAVTQLLHQAEWDVADALDALIVDLPPGTGDAQLTLTQSVPLSGAVIVSTPQDIALIDARRAVQMFQRLSVPVLGLIENMSYFCCPACGHRAEIFGHGGARVDAARMEIPFLGEIPLDMRIRETSDAGTPIVLEEPEGIIAGTYRQIADFLRHCEPLAKQSRHG
jgi:ATP-binding protein involved in chromosome partitioning